MDTFPNDQTADLGLLQDLMKQAKSLGADQADAIFIRSTSLSLGQRLGKPESLERSENADVGLRVLLGKRQAIVSSSDFSAPALKELSERAVSMAKVVPEDPYAGLAEADQLATNPIEIDAFDPAEPAADLLKERARLAEEAALAVEGVTNSEGAEAGWGMSRISVAATNGFAETYSGSRHSVSVAVVAGTGDAMEVDYDYASTVYGEDLEDPAKIGTSAGTKAVRRLNPAKAKTASVPVIYDPRVARSLVGHLSSAINGSSIARGTSFLKDAMDTDVFGAHVTITDDPHRHRGLRSMPFDAEGLATVKRNVIDSGRLTTWFLDLRSARQLGLTSTGHAGRGTSSPPSPSASNLFMQPGDKTPGELMADIEAGLYITDMMGMGINGVTGDYSRGASGFWIENGELAYPVSEVTVAGNLKDMFKVLIPANDLVFRYGTDAPTIRVDGMTVAGA
ncbi:MAG: TldD/PmbA family protein [Magnetovibrionaceae bacterium]